MSAHQHDEGHTVAGWTGTVLATVGVTVAGAGVCAGNALWVWGGPVLVAISVLVTWTLHLTGWGKPPGPRPADQWAWRTRDLSARHGHPGCVGCRLAGRRPTTDAAPAATEPVPVESGPGGSVPGEPVTGEPGDVRGPAYARE
ncbi:HGxxPAAW family protein [Streptomyces sp. SAS_270]|uniref:HGxxPAAW family protein n=1 Tax=Streptomyces sp. SAS_270 TaxID=3412748 RepID=UPI00403C20CD